MLKYGVSACPSALNLLGVCCLFPSGLLIGGLPASSKLQALVLSCARTETSHLHKYSVLSSYRQFLWKTVAYPRSEAWVGMSVKIVWFKMLSKPILQASSSFSLMMRPSGKYFLICTRECWSSHFFADFFSFWLGFTICGFMYRRLKGTVVQEGSVWKWF